ncbi:Rieske [2Fe-2S] iron-sulfur domain-containing protein [Gemmatirosa kalamazoonensis]|uniref:Rieske [2Fe-2S] iron-sulfur domain-containing protein n=1 Tax=Gemmatirosa kalamazoonensis TaxID=861299 RepID=W0RE19_9BACT|nr:Rieske (2Fe-2S) protein [Gemmatirosa kalamazoonensis]AHG89334.1 Rieske [2Fe-2S] iron-sulfur domain-containing protein [Gemmatirosa kalamazoonensis]
MPHHAASPDADRCAAACPLASAAGAVGALDRRTFLSQSLLAAAAAALAACGAAGDTLTAPASVNSSIDVASYPALASTGGIAVVSLSGTRLAIVRTGTSSFAALSLVCPHEGGSINQNGTGFLCSKHGARFTASGTWTGGERTTNMRSYPATYDATTGTLTIG